MITNFFYQLSQRNKLKKFADILRFPNVYENFYPLNAFLQNGDQKEILMNGKWNSDHFKKEAKLCLELACGRGEYTLALGEKYKDTHFIGLDIKGARIWQGAKTALDSGLNNVAFLRARIENIASFFDKEEVQEMWITFPDPFLRDSKENRRLTSHNFLNRYLNFLHSDNTIHLKTDSPELYEFTLESLESYERAIIIEHYSDIYSLPALPNPDLVFQTYYERQHLSNKKTIKYVRFQLDID